MGELTFKISEERKEQLRERLSDEGFEIFWDSVYVNDEEAAKRHPFHRFGVRAYRPVGRISEGSFVIDDGDYQNKLIGVYGVKG